MKRYLALLFGLCFAFATGRAEAVPSIVAFTGRLTTSAGPVDGDVEVTFRIMSAQTGGNELWTETYATLSADGGLVFASLGSQEPLDATIFDGSIKYIEITVEGETLSPRLPIGSVPYSVHSDTSDYLGDIAPADVVTGVTGGGGVRATRAGNTVTLSVEAGAGLAVSGTTVGLTTCANGQVLKSTGTGWACAADAGTTYTAGAGIAISGTTVGFATCPAGQILKSNGAGYACAVDVDTNTAYAAGAGIAISGTTVSLATCPAGQILKSNGAGYACAADAGTTYSGTAPITVSGSSIGLQACTAGQVLKHNGSAWVCAPDAGPIAFGFVFSNATRASGSTNWTVSYNATAQHYLINITGENYLYSAYTTVVTATPLSSQPGVTCHPDSVGGALVVICDNSAGTHTQANFQFATFK